MLLRIKQFKISTYGIGACIIIAVATLLRVYLIAQGWPHSNADEDTMGIMAMHIAYHGEHPIFFYGQNYMGTLEAYLAAAFFHLFGASVFTLRLGPVLFFALFLTCMYLLTSLLDTKKLALITLALLTLGSSIMLDTELVAIGGYPELLFFGSLSLLLASWLVLSYDQYSSPRRRLWRLLAYACWGLVVGSGFWSNFLMLSFILVSGLLLVLFCWRELLKGAMLSLVLGLLIGAFPLIVYNLHAAPGENTLQVLAYLHKTGSLELAQIRAHYHLPLEPELRGTMLIGLPAATGGTPFCYDPHLMLTGYLSFPSIQCSILQGNWGLVIIALAWSLGFILLWTIAVVLTIKKLWKLGIRTPGHRWSPAEKYDLKRQFARLMLLCSAGFIFAGIAMTSNVGNDDHSHTRTWFTFTSFKLVLGRGILLIIGIVLLVGTINAFVEIPAVQANNHQQDVLIQGLLRIKATHIYTDYWTCDSIAFQSKERIICVVVNAQLKVQPRYSRYAPYLKIVKADPNSAYVFLIGAGQIPAIAKRAALSPGRYQRYVFGDYIVYQPVSLN